MSAAVYQIQIERGVTFQREITVRDAVGSVVPLSDYTAVWRLRSTLESEDIVVFGSDTDPEVVLVVGEQGTVTIKLSAGTTRTLDLGSGGYYELEIKSSAGDVTRLLRGGVGFDRDVMSALQAAPV